MSTINYDGDDGQPALTFYKNTVGMSDKTEVALYTTSMEDWRKFETELAFTVAYAMVKWALIGTVIGVFIGFFTFAKADPKVISQIKQAAPTEYQTTLLALAEIESSFRPAVIGDAKEFGLFQFHPRFFELKDKSVKGQVKEAVKHIKWLKTHCPADLAVAWNLGCKDAQEIKKPKQFKYYIKFTNAKEKYEKQKSEDSGSPSSGFSKVANSSYSHKEI